ncbi:MAG: nucleotidyltransferase family protein [Saprospiraceae bacterium]
MEIIENKKKELYEVCSNYKVDELYAFGSLLTEQFNKESDIDLIVSIISEDPLEYAENYFELKFALEKLFNRKIDLLEQKSIGNKTFGKLVNKKKKLIYARKNHGLA